MADCCYWISNGYGFMPCGFKVLVETDAEKIARLQRELADLRDERTAAMTTLDECSLENDDEVEDVCGLKAKAAIIVKLARLAEHGERTQRQAVVELRQDLASVSQHLADATQRLADIAA